MQEFVSTPSTTAHAGHLTDGFPNPARVRIALAEKGATSTVEFIADDVPSGAHRKPELLAKNPSSAVPVLELEDGTTFSECTAITECLEHTFDDPSLTGKILAECKTLVAWRERVATRPSITG